MDPNLEKDKKWYQLAVEDALHQLGSAPEGPTSSEAALRLEKYGPNKLGDEQPASPLRVFLNQFKNPLIYILLLAAAVTASLGMFKDKVEQEHTGEIKVRFVRPDGS